MFRLDRRPFIFGVIAGIIGVKVIGRGLKNAISGKVTIIQLTLSEGNTEPKSTEEN